MVAGKKGRKEGSGYIDDVRLRGNLDIKLVLSNSSRIWLPFQRSPLFSLLSSHPSSFFLFTFAPPTFL